MEERHRKIIEDNLECLMDNSNYEKLMNACIHNGIISQTMKYNIEESNSDDRIRHKQLFKKLTHRGPTAFETLIQILTNLKYLNATKILRRRPDDEFISIKSKKENEFGHLNNNITNINSFNNSNNNENASSEGCTQSQQDVNDASNVNIALSVTSDDNKLRVYDKKIQQTLKVRKSKKYFIETKIGVYQMRKENRGVLFMVNIIDFPQTKSDEKRRNGAEIDGERLLDLFNNLGFTLFYYKNLSSKQFYNLLDELIDSEYIKDTECFVMALMSHGSMANNEDRVEFSNGAIESVNNILERFKNDVCQNLVGKPKVFFFPFCRGDNSDRGVRVETDSIMDHPINVCPTYSDILLCYGSVPGFRTHRDPDKGSWYIQKLCEIFAEHAHDTDLDDMLKLITKTTGNIRTTDGRLQTPSSTGHGWSKKLYFNPGCYDKDDNQ